MGMVLAPSFLTYRDKQSDFLSQSLYLERQNQYLITENFCKSAFCVCYAVFLHSNRIEITTKMMF